jgi:hypothetical protein
VINVARRNLTDQLIPRDCIKEQLKLIDGSNTDYITPTGNVYKDYGNNMFFKKKTYISNSCGYTYCGIYFADGSIKSRRVHVLVAKAYLPNPNNLPYVGHKHNNKADTDLKELYWTDARENTQRAYDDGVAVTDSGFDDSQSFPIDVYTKYGDYIESCGSAHIASARYGVSISTVLRHCNNEVGSYRKQYTFRYFGDNFNFNN